jgi:succinyl-diaminopimelate desuccinylase
MTSQPAKTDPGLAERLAALTLELVDIPSVSRDEAAVLDLLVALMPEDSFALIDEGDAVRFFAPARRGSGVPFVVLAGHADTVPPNGNLPGRLKAGAVSGCGAADMKGAIAVMVEVAAWLASNPGISDLDVGLLFFGREELPITESAVLPLLDRCSDAREIDLAVLMEPTANAIQIGCMGNLNARVTLHGHAAHSARPWLGENAIHLAIAALGPLADLPPRDVELDGLTFREVVSVTRIEGGIAANVIPDRVEAHVNYRYAPSLTPPEAEARMRELLDPRAELDVIGNAPPGPVSVLNPLVTRLRDAGDLPVGPKQAWTPVAEFATIDVDAVNFGPGDPGYAHRDDERVEVAALVRSYEVLRTFLEGPTAAREGRPT